MSNYELIQFPDADSLALAVATRWLGEVSGASRAGLTQAVALSGGRITQKFFASIVEQSKIRPLSLSTVHFFWADERCVPPTDAESNFKLADDLLFRPMGIKAEQIHRIQGELPPAQAAELAVKDLAAVAPQLDLVFLGMGEDGHVASLFPGEDEASRQNPAVFRAIANSPKPPPNRVTLGYGAIAAAKQVWVLANGQGKEAALRATLSPTGDTPLGRVLKMRAHTKVFSDIKL